MAIKKGKNIKNNVLQLIYNLTNYRSYHAYRVRLSVVRSFLWLAVSFWIIRIFTSNAAAEFAINDIIIFLLAAYVIGSYFVVAKASAMFKDSKQVMQELAFSGQESFSWNIYDGILKNKENENDSVEIIFFREKAFLTSLR